MFKIAILILNYNSEEYTIKTLFSLFENIDLNKNYFLFNIFVLDNGSDNDPKERINKLFPNVNYLKSQTNLGVAGGRNFGIKKIKSINEPDYYLILDNDLYFKNNFLDKLLEPFNIDENIGISSCIIKYSLTSKIQTIGWKKNLLGKIVPIKKINSTEYITSIAVSGCVQLIKKDVFKNIGLYNEIYFPYGEEDLDIGIRALKNNFKILITTKTYCLHRADQKYKKETKFMYFVLKNQFHFFKKNLPFISLIIIFIIKLIKNIFNIKLTLLLLKAFYLSIFKPQKDKIPPY